MVTQFYGFTRVAESDEGGGGLVGLAVIFCFSAAMSLTCIVKATHVARARPTRLLLPAASTAGTQGAFVLVDPWTHC